LCEKSKVAIAAMSEQINEENTSIGTGWQVAAVDCGNHFSVCTKFMTHKQKYPLLAHVEAPSGNVVANISDSKVIGTAIILDYIQSYRNDDNETDEL
jgi:hypothetical protein